MAHLKKHALQVDTSLRVSNMIVSHDWQQCVCLYGRKVKHLKVHLVVKPSEGSGRRPVEEHRLLERGYLIFLTHEQ